MLPTPPHFSIPFASPFMLFNLGWSTPFPHCPHDSSLFLFSLPFPLHTYPFKF